jgi:hypothetical protein
MFKFSVLSMKRGAILKAALVVLALLFLSACSSTPTGYFIYNSADDIFADCDSFLAYYDSCDLFLDAYDDSICKRSYVSMDKISKSDRQCYPAVECSAFFAEATTKARLAECRYEQGGSKCVLSFDVQCTDHSATSEAITLTIKNNQKTPYNIKKVRLSLHLTDQTIDCTDSDNDAILAAGEEDVFTCRPLYGSIPLPKTRALKATINLQYSDYRTNAMHTKTGVMISDV